MKFAILHNTQLFRGLSDDEISEAMSRVAFRISKFRSGAVIVQSGEEVKDYKNILSGKVKSEMIDIAGKVIKIEDIPAPGALAPAFIFGRGNRYPVNVISVTDSELLVIDRKEFLKLLHSNERILVNFLDIISNRSQFLSDKIRFLSFSTIRSKLAEYILKLKPEGSDTVILDRSQSDLAEFFGVTRPSIGRAIAELEERGLIEAKGKSVRITDHKGLKGLVAR